MSDGICDECGTDTETTLELIDELIAAKSDLTAKLAEAEQSNHRLHNKVAEYRAERDELRAEVARLSASPSRGYAKKVEELIEKLDAEKQAREAAEARLTALREVVPQLQEALDYCHEQTACRAAVKVAIVIRTMQSALAKSGEP